MSTPKEERRAVLDDAVARYRAKVDRGEFVSDWMSQIQLTAQQTKEVDEVWDRLAGDTCWVDAVMVWAGRVQLSGRGGGWLPENEPIDYTGRL